MQLYQTESKTMLLLLCTGMSQWEPLFRERHFKGTKSALFISIKVKLHLI